MGKGERMLPKGHWAVWDGGNIPPATQQRSAHSPAEVRPCRSRAWAEHPAVLRTLALVGITQDHSRGLMRLLPRVSPGREAPSELCSASAELLEENKKWSRKDGIPNAGVKLAADGGRRHGGSG